MSIAKAAEYLRRADALIAEAQAILDQTSGRRKARDAAQRLDEAREPLTVARQYVSVLLNSGGMR